MMNATMKYEMGMDHVYTVEFDSEYSCFDILVTDDAGNIVDTVSKLILGDASVFKLDDPGLNIYKLNKDTKFILFKDSVYDPYTITWIYAQYSTDSFEEAVKLAKKDLESDEMKRALFENHRANQVSLVNNDNLKEKTQ